jgi:hypothetical protein
LIVEPFQSVGDVADEGALGPAYAGFWVGFVQLD